MKRRIISFVLALTLLLSVLPSAAFASGESGSELQPVASNTEEFAGGNGTESDPYLVSTKAHLNNVRNYLDAHFKMTNDIVFTASDFAEGGAFYNDGAGWTPIGDSSISGFTFSGVFDGNGFAVKNLYVNRTIKSGNNSFVYAGLFGYCSRATIKNLGMKASEITLAASDYTNSSARAGGIVAYADKTTITNCYNTGTVTSDDMAGGIVGYTYNNSTITDCYNIGNISVESIETKVWAGGIVGNCGMTTITNCYNTGNIDAVASNQDYAYAGGIAGVAGTDTTTTNCYNTGNITASGWRYGYAGGIIGDANFCTITDCYNIGSVTASPSYYAYAGGIVGRIYSTATAGVTLGRCYNTGSITVSANNYRYAGGIAGIEEGGNATVTNCYYLDNIAAGVGGGSTSGFYVRTDAQLRKTSNLSGFNFSNVWTMAGNANYPYPELQGMYQVNCNSHQTVSYAGKTATCTESGWKSYVTCSRCYYTTYEAIDALGHDEQPHDGKAATCTESGWKSYVTCNRCDYTTYEAIDALGHDEQPHDGKAATCTESGWKSYVTCSRCDYTTYEAIDALGHDEQPHDGKAATCTESGWKSYVTCNRCDYTTYEAIDTLGHEEVSHDAQTPTCTEIGWNAYVTCSRCDYTTYEAIAATGHSEVIDEAEAATCTTAGKTEGKHCSVCSAVLVKQETIPAKGHTEVTVPGKAATCTERGWEPYVTCSRCDYTTYEEIAAGHTNVDGICSVCGLPEGLEYKVSGGEAAITDYTGSLAELTIPSTINGNTVTVIGQSAFSMCRSLTSVTIPDSVTTIGSSAFNHCTNLVSVTIPGSVTKLGDMAFEGCSSLESVVIPSGITTIGMGVFAYCRNLTEVNLPSNLTAIGNFAFESCSNLSSITLPDSLTEIGQSAFNLCDNLESITIPSNVTKIGAFAFSNCDDLAEIVFTGNAPDFGTSVFQSTTTTAYYPCNNSTWTADRLKDYGGTITWKVQHGEEMFVPGKAATCTESGKTDGKKCSVCGTVTVAQKTIAAKGHTYVDGVCTVCGAKDPNYVAGLTGVTRIFGADRYETAFKTAEVLKQQLGVEKFDSIVVACGDNFADALGGSYLAAKKNAPILLVKSSKIDAVKSYIKANLNPGGTVYLLGGTAAIPAAMDTGLDGFNVQRLAGATRYDTNLLILEEAGVTNEDILICTGKNFADSLSAAAAGRPILLVKDSLNDSQKAFLQSHAANKKYILGGTAAVSTSVENQAKAYGTVKRIGGNTRYETSVLIAQEFFPDATQAALAYAQNFPDGLSGGALAYAMKAPLVLTASGKEAAAAAYAKEQGITSGVILGGSGLISDKAVRTIFQMQSGDVIQIG